MMADGTSLDQPAPTPDDVARAYTVTVERIPTVLDEVFVNTVVEMYTDPLITDDVEDVQDCIEAYVNGLQDILFPSPQARECEEDPLSRLPLP